MKLRVLTATKKGKLLEIANILSAAGNADKAADVIPPAYSCDRERLVVLVITAASKMPNAFEIFCKDLGKARAQNVALLIDGAPEKAAPIMEWLNQAGANIIEEVLYMNGGLPFKFMRGVTEEEKQTATEWLKRVLDKVTNG